MSDRGHPMLRRKAVESRLARRRRRERRFRLYCQIAVGCALLALVILFGDILRKGWSGFFQTEILLEVRFDRELLDPRETRDPEVLSRADFAPLWREPLKEMLGEPETRQERREMYALVSEGAIYGLRELVLEDPSLVGESRRLWLPASSEVDLMVKGRVSRDLPEGERPLNDRQLAWMDRLRAQKRIDVRFDTGFFTEGDSRNPVTAGIAAAAVGSFWAMLVTLLLSFPLGVATAVYLEEFAPKNSRWIDLIEVNINNLAAVPSIVFGLLGLAVFLNFFDLPRSAPLVGGLILALMTLPVIIIAARSAIQSVPPSIRQGAYGLGATRMQVIQHHVLPMAMPGILTGTIIGMARALGETAPLLMIGMVAFIVDIPEGPFDPATALPVQVYLWADSPERGFVEKTSAAIMVLLGFLITMNGLAVWLRRRWEQR
ncbi:MAG: phosphate ABC transporter permease PstA [Thermoanaerobaculia bacterium]|nr:phosphate ABC transporter permease PstA [Thermoanaerobaculia bacterium]